ncbi:MAG: prepilin-type N-terminal cleavage/methylation domain-containing protein [Colwellia sp.]|nr:prepilin-type N-terminal cleavage/methylation domain-containing protein [Colwellia sp.]
MKANTRVKGITKGFTLIELIVGIVVLSISFSLLISLILPLSEKSAEQLHQVRAAELGQSMMNEIIARAFDQQSDMTGGLIRCGENGVVCTSNNNLGADNGETERALYNDVDDYDGYDTDSTDDENVLGESFSSLYPGFRVQVAVCYSQLSTTSTNCSSSIELAKLITVTVTTPQDFDFVFSFYKANF